MIAMVGGRRKSYNGGISRYQLAKGGRGIFGGRRDSARNLQFFAHECSLKEYVVLLSENDNEK